MITLSSTTPQVQVSVLGTFDDGVVRNLTGADTGTSYQIKDPTVVRASPNGLISGGEKGPALVVISSQGVGTFLRVFVSRTIDSDGDGMHDLVDNCPAVSNPAHLVPTDCNGDTDSDDPGEGVGEQCDLDGDGPGGCDGRR